MKGGMYLSDGEWSLLEPLIPKAKRRKDGRGRPPRNPREVLNGIIWILVSGAPWHLLPKQQYPSYQTCHRYFQQWVQKGVMQKMLSVLSSLYTKSSKQQVDVIDGSFSAAKKGATR
jgi:transposase